MNTLAHNFASAILIGLGATLTFDLWGLFAKYAFHIQPSDICLVGRWLRYMPEGTLKHSNIRSTQPKSAECALGWIAHYLIGITFALIYVNVMGDPWLQHPTLIPAVGFGVLTVLAPFFILQPSLGFGLAASKTSNPALARLRSLLNHTAFGVGIYLFGLLVNWVLPASI